MEEEIREKEQFVNEKLKIIEDLQKELAVGKEGDNSSRKMSLGSLSDQLMPRKKSMKDIIASSSNESEHSSVHGDEPMLYDTEKREKNEIKNINLIRNQFFEENLLSSQPEYLEIISSINIDLKIKELESKVSSELNLLFEKDYTEKMDAFVQEQKLKTDNLLNQKEEEINLKYKLKSENAIEEKLKVAEIQILKKIEEKNKQNIEQKIFEIETNLKIANEEKYLSKIVKLKSKTKETESRMKKEFEEMHKEMLIVKSKEIAKELEEKHVGEIILKINEETKKISKELGEKHSLAIDLKTNEVEKITGENSNLKSQIDHLTKEIQILKIEGEDFKRKSSINLGSSDATITSLKNDILLNKSQIEKMIDEKKTVDEKLNKLTVHFYNIF